MTEWDQAIGAANEDEAKETLNKLPFAGNSRLILVDEKLVNRILS